MIEYDWPSAKNRLLRIAEELEKEGNKMPRMATGINLKTCAARVKENVDRYERGLKQPNWTAPYIELPHPEPLCIMHNKPLGACSDCGDVVAESVEEKETIYRCRRCHYTVAPGAISYPKYCEQETEDGICGGSISEM